MGVFLEELKRRKVFRVGAAYAVVAWLILQVIDVAFPRLGLPDWTITLILILLLIGFPVALILAWAFEVKPEGKSGKEGSSPTLNYVIAGALVSALAFIAIQNLAPRLEQQSERSVKTAKSVAVLPFDDMSPNGDQVWFSDGLTDEILNSLSRLADLKVISRTSSFHFRDQGLPLREIARRLDVAHIVEGSVRRSGDTLRVTAQLIRAEDDSHVWSETFDASADDVFSVQEEVAEKIATALDIFLDDAQRDAMFASGTRNVGAWELYSKASRLEHEWYLTYGVGDKLWRASALTEQALELDPGYLAAQFLHVTAYTHFIMGENSDGAPEGLTIQAAQEVILGDFEAAASLARNETERDFFRLNRVYYSDDWTDMPHLIDSLDLDVVQGIILASVSGHAIDNMLITLGRKEEAFDYLQEALRRSPFDPSLWWHLSGAAFGLGGPDLAFEYIDLGPAEFKVNHIRKTVYTLIAAGRAEDALTLVQNYGGNESDFASAFALVLAYAGRQAEAREVLDAVSDADYEHWRFAWALDVAGYPERAEAMFRSIDSKPGGPQALMLYATGIYGGNYVHNLDWTPGLVAQLAQAGAEPERLIIPGQ